MEKELLEQLDVLINTLQEEVDYLKLLKEKNEKTDNDISYIVRDSIQNIIIRLKHEISNLDI